MTSPCQARVGERLRVGDRVRVGVRVRVRVRVGVRVRVRVGVGVRVRVRVRVRVGARCITKVLLLTVPLLPTKYYLYLRTEMRVLRCEYSSSCTRTGTESGALVQGTLLNSTSYTT